ncbi:hypothetical protein PHYBLDRAFT_149863 [Phycomyces blakesleeanus NRRL 1555(-)]|uniref:Uncharacterized protein n=1 Tax=Phycomyces blakesleeanus (strain ATCC 8743b / DSM 1359 / FGSC 10004 / NBRC 33097 / NRRL 1555) TaxID=763407 RepID=A0A167KTP9_PHYB8|nr:hypothetical protein PHYBLDRAFT_149863 [Phycomyces blakesleeanus NRRL 1555(-)]OAD68857.1 hypothetical protein PHYBLDRAFT_149863 [Phycomyces blakesleeanus NRRL 1555(-)]|eukprot:XP_018286897.1 hypothetical protein PHYBLDRAFT_149863 [Phycomyces blakesleeanus NRRL 1555(-)]
MTDEFKDFNSRTGPRYSEDTMLSSIVGKFNRFVCCNACYDLTPEMLRSQVSHEFLKIHVERAGADLGYSP